MRVFYLASLRNLLELFTVLGLLQIEVGIADRARIGGDRFNASKPGCSQKTPPTVHIRTDRSSCFDKRRRKCPRIFRVHWSLRLLGSKNSQKCPLASGSPEQTVKRICDSHLTLPNVNLSREISFGNSKCQKKQLCDFQELRCHWT